MLLAFIGDLPLSTSMLLVVCLLAVCFFEAINGFHDTANAVATVIYTKTLKPTHAVVWSGIWNFLGVYVGGIAVAVGIMKLIPLDDLFDTSVGVDENAAMVLAVLIAAIVWNFGTWYLGIPSSSSHTLIGALLGAGWAFWSVHDMTEPNWAEAKKTGLSLLISPLFGFSLAILLMYVLKSTIKNKVIFKEPDPKKAPPLWIRAILVGTCTLVSFFHGSNDGQKGVGLLLVVLMAFLPTQYVINHDVPFEKFRQSAHNLEYGLGQMKNGEHAAEISVLADKATQTAALLDRTDTAQKTSLYDARKSVNGLCKDIAAAEKNGKINKSQAKILAADLSTLKSSYEFAPTWAILLIAICLGIGTMIGWKRIVVTIGEKIGKSHLTYAQGACAEICAACTIGFASLIGRPVSTTHVLSSGIAGTMVASGGIKNLQKKTVKNIATAWLLTLPVSFVLAAVLFFFLRVII
jgi:inorganic phosphate transporter, PiT family